MTHLHLVYLSVGCCQSFAVVSCEPQLSTVFIYVCVCKSYKCICICMACQYDECIGIPIQLLLILLCHYIRITRIYQVRIYIRMYIIMIASIFCYRLETYSSCRGSVMCRCLEHSYVHLELTPFPNYTRNMHNTELVLVQS